MKRKLQNYKQVKKISEHLLKEKGEATAKEISTKINEEYDMKQLRVSPKKVSSYLRNYSSGRRDRHKVLIFKYKD